MTEALVVSNLVLWVVVLALLVAVFALARQIGILYERVAPMGALMIDSGPAVGEAAPRLDLATLDGGRLAVGAAAEHSQLLFFVSPTCPVCKKLLPIVKSIAAAEAGWLRVVFASDGEPEAHVAMRRRAALEAFPYVLSTELGMAFRVGKLPYAVLLDEAGRVRAKGLVNSREQLESLFTAKELNVASVQQYVAGEGMGS
ncbi:MAG: methylamine dehydrogenase accessory protein MauD [Burkholderiales bacterium]|nr:methylamine dehydrogenase accessory protein MauD [Burkholderiales bacterium]